MLYDVMDILLLLTVALAHIHRHNSKINTKKGIISNWPVCLLIPVDDKHITAPPQRQVEAQQISSLSHTFLFSTSYVKPKSQNIRTGCALS